MASYKYMGTSDEITTCECCGKKHLKRTIALLHEDGTIVYYGSNCAAKTLGNKTKKSSVDHVADMMATVQKWAASEKNFSAKVIADGIWNRYGALYDLRGNLIKFYFGSFDLDTKQWV